LIKVIAVLVFALLSNGAWAHKASDSFLYFNGDNQELRLDLALRDMLRLQDMDLDGDGALRWAELQASETAFKRYIKQGLKVQQQGRDKHCPITMRLAGITQYSDGPYASWLIRSPCFAESSGLSLDYQLLFDRDPLHRALYRLADGESESIGVLSPSQHRLSLDVTDGSAWQTISNFFYQGVIHLLLGYDHLLFLLVLLLPVLNNKEGISTPMAAVKELSWIVTMFTLSHSITLVLATLGWLVLPSGPVEVTIALSISLAALLAFWPHRRFQRYLALGFGLIHGLGFAGVLAGLLSQSASTPLALASFNIGIETAQIALVIMAVMLLYPIRHTMFFQRVLVPGSLGITAMAGLFWAVNRL
jgi:hypothetical protein